MTYYKTASRRHTAKADTLLRVEERGVPQHALDAAGAARELRDGDLVDNLPVGADGKPGQS